jgi:hypothetical protein
MQTVSRPVRVGLAVFVCLVVSVLATPIALAKFSVKKLHVGSVAGAEDYLFTPGNTVVEQATVDRGRYYRFDVYDASGTIRLATACRPSPGSGVTAASYRSRWGRPATAERVR